MFGHVKFSFKQQVCLSLALYGLISVVSALQPMSNPDDQKLYYSSEVLVDTLDNAQQAFDILQNQNLTETEADWATQMAADLSWNNTLCQRLEKDFMKPTVSLKAGQEQSQLAMAVISACLATDAFAEEPVLYKACNLNNGATTLECLQAFSASDLNQEISPKEARLEKRALIAADKYNNEFTQKRLIKRSKKAKVIRSIIAVVTSVWASRQFTSTLSKAAGINAAEQATRGLRIESILQRGSNDDVPTIPGHYLIPLKADRITIGARLQLPKKFVEAGIDPERVPILFNNIDACSWGSMKPVFTLGTWTEWGYCYAWGVYVVNSNEDEEAPLSALAGLTARRHASKYQAYFESLTGAQLGSVASIAGIAITTFSLLSADTAALTQLSLSTIFKVCVMLGSVFGFRKFGKST